MKIAIVSYQGYDGAGVIHAHYFANHLQRRGHDVLFLLNGDALSSDLMTDPPEYRLVEVAFSSGVLSSATRREIESFAPQVIHLWTPRHLPARIGIEAWSITDARLLIHYEDDEEYILGEIASNQMFCSDDLDLYQFMGAETCDPRKLDRWILDFHIDYLRQTIFEPRCWNWLHPIISPIAEKLADAYTSITPTYQRVLRRRHDKPVRVLYPGVDLEKFAPRDKPPKLVRRLGLEDRLVMLYSGAIAEFHDFVSLLKALPPVVARFPDIALVQVGQNFIKHITDPMLEELGLRDHVVLAGPVPHHTMPSYLALADVFIGSLRTDEFNAHRLPSKIPEYMAMGRPMLICDLSIGHELEPGLEAVKVHDDSPKAITGGLEDLLERQGSWVQMGERLREKARRLFDWERNTEGLESFYEEVVENGKPHRAEGLDPGRQVPELTELGWVSPKMAVRRSGKPTTRQRVALVTEGRVGKRMSGIGIRYLEIARALSRRFDVSIGLREEPEGPLDGIDLFRWSGRGRSLPEEVREADVVVVHGYALAAMPSLREVPGRLVVDLYCPWVFENLEIHRDRGLSMSEQSQLSDIALRVLREQVAFGDYFICSSARQRDWVMGLLTAIGRLHPGLVTPGFELDDIVGILPSGLPAEVPKPSSKRRMRGVWEGVEEDDVILLWGGGLWSWLDSLTVVEAMAKVAEERSDVKLVFLSTRTAESVIGMPRLKETVDLAKELGLIGNAVIFNDSSYIPYEDRLDYFFEADIGVCAHVDSLESHYAFRTRVLDYLHVGLPVLTSAGDFFGELVEERKLGRAMASRDVDGWAEAILELAGSSKMRQRCSARVLEERERWTWDRAVEPLAEYCAAVRAGDIGPARRVMLGDLESAESAGAPTPHLLGQVLDRVDAHAKLAEELTTENANAKEYAAHLEDELATLRDGYDDVAKWARELEEQLAVKESALRLGVEREEAFAEERAALAERQAVLVGRHDELTAQLTTVTAQLETVTGDLAAERSELTELAGRLEISQEHAARLEAKVDMLRKIPLAEPVWRWFDKRH